MNVRGNTRITLSSAALIRASDDGWAGEERFIKEPWDSPTPSWSRWSLHQQTQRTAFLESQMALFLNLRKHELRTRLDVSADRDTVIPENRLGLVVTIPIVFSLCTMLKYFATSLCDFIQMCFYHKMSDILTVVPTGLTFPRLFTFLQTSLYLICKWLNPPWRASEVMRMCVFLNPLI